MTRRGVRAPPTFTETDMNTKPLKDVTDDELLAFARLAHGLMDLNGRHGRATILAKLAEAGWEASDDRPVTIFEMLSPEQQRPGQSGVTHRKYVGNGEWVECEEGETDAFGRAVAIPGRFITVMKGRDDDGDHPVYTNVNGSSLSIPRGEMVWVPLKNIEALQNAVEYYYPEGDEGLTEAPSEIPVYPFSMH